MFCYIKVKCEGCLFMLELLTDSIGAIIGNMILFLIIPFVWWIIKWRKKISFFKWVGIIKPKLVSN